MPLLNSARALQVLLPLLQLVIHSVSQLPCKVCFEGGQVYTQASGGTLQNIRGLAMSKNLEEVYITSAAGRFGKITVNNGLVTWLVGGTGDIGYRDGFRDEALFILPRSLAMSPDGNTVYIADRGNQRIRTYNISNGNVSTLAGNGDPGFRDGDVTSANYRNPEGIAVMPDGRALLVADRGNLRIRRVDVSTGVTTTIAGGGTADSGDGTGTNARFVGPTSIAIAPDGLMAYVADEGLNGRVRGITLADNSVFTLSYLPFTFNGGVFPSAIALSPDGLTALILERNLVVGIEVKTGCSKLIAGIVGGSGLNNGGATSALFSNPQGIVAIGKDNLLVADTGNALLRKVTLPVIYNEACPKCPNSLPSNSRWLYINKQGEPTVTNSSGACLWECESGYFFSNETSKCEPCSTFPCPTGYYRTRSQCVPEMDGQCSKCANAKPRNAHFLRLERGGQCTWQCDLNYLLQGNEDQCNSMEAYATVHLSGWIPMSNKKIWARKSHLEAAVAAAAVMDEVNVQLLSADPDSNDPNGLSFVVVVCHTIHRTAGFIVDSLTEERLNETLKTEYFPGIKIAGVWQIQVVIIISVTLSLVFFVCCCTLCCWRAEKEYYKRNGGNRQQMKQQARERVMSSVGAARSYVEEAFPVLKNVKSSKTHPDSAKVREEGEEGEEGDEREGHENMEEGGPGEDEQGNKGGEAKTAKKAKGKSWLSSLMSAGGANRGKKKKPAAKPADEDVGKGDFQEEDDSWHNDDSKKPQAPTVKPPPLLLHKAKSASASASSRGVAVYKPGTDRAGPPRSVSTSSVSSGPALKKTNSGKNVYNDATNPRSKGNRGLPMYKSQRGAELQESRSQSRLKSMNEKAAPPLPLPNYNSAKGQGLQASRSSKSLKGDS